MRIGMRFREFIQTINTDILIHMKKVTLLLGLLMAVSGLTAQVVHNPYWGDQFNVADVSELGDGLGQLNATAIFPRQGGKDSIVGVPYVQSGIVTSPGDDWMISLQGGVGASHLRLASSNSKTLVSPDFDFGGIVTGTKKEGEIMGRKISFTLDLNTIPFGGTTNVKAGITIGSTAPLQPAQNFSGSTDGFSISFVDDDAFGNGRIIQIYEDGVLLFANVGTFPEGPFDVEITVDDSADGNPWDGVGTTEVGISINGTAILGGFILVQDGAKYTGNYITLEAGSTEVYSGDPLSYDFNTLGASTFDNLTVFSAIPEPTTIGLVLGLLAFAGVMWRRQRQD